MELGLRLANEQRQMMTLTPKMLQAMKLLQLPLLELDVFLRQEMQQNPVLEELQQEPSPSDDEPEVASDAVLKDDEQTEDDAGDDGLDSFVDEWNDYYFEGSDFSRNPNAQEQRDYWESTITGSTSLSSHLLEQLHMTVRDEEDLEIGEWLIGEIDERGYFTGSVEECARQTGYDPEHVEGVLRIIQTLEPAGVGARDLAECLLLQLDRDHPDYELLLTLIVDHLTMLEKNQLPKIARSMGISIEEVQRLASIIARLEPRPGRAFSTDTPRYIVPDVTVDMIDGKCVVTVNDDRVPRLRISHYYRQLLANKDTPKHVREYIREKYRAARALLQNIEQRKTTIQRVCEAIFEVQKEFLEKGDKALKPLTLQQIADVVGMHEATISRVTSTKYVDTPQGVYRLKHFFSSSIGTDNGHDTSSASVKKFIADMIDKEDKSKPLSDKQIADMLLEKYGTKLARRTVAKYRESLGILSSSLRREYNTATE
ncbi:MAG: RNA polymerase factor sigma-54 [Candidatus Hydrogenedentes bacterium]|nr:RNA polymerase factor sigma-54 [Candidatus Hydrogenedentota bacterium]